MRRTLRKVTIGIAGAPVGIETREEIFLRLRPSKEYNEGKIGVSKGIYCNVGIRNNIFFFI
ncbi:MAG: hypothetical protein ACFFAN_00985 [Promethearchaeota archaeon]